MPWIHSLNSALMVAVSLGISRQTSVQSAGFAMLAARANKERVNRARRRAVMFAPV